LKTKTFFFQREERYLKISTEDQDFRVQNQPLKTEIESEDFIFVHLIAMYPNSLKYNTNFICSQFCDYKFWHAQWDNLYFSSLSPKLKLPSPTNIFFKDAMATKNVASQVSKKNIGSF